MKPLLVILSLVFLTSCSSKSLYSEDLKTTVSEDSEITLDNFKSTKYPNIFISKHINLDEKYLDDTYKYLMNFCDFMESNFSNNIVLEDESKIDFKNLKIYFTAADAFTRAKYKEKYPNIFFSMKINMLRIHNAFFLSDFFNFISKFNKKSETSFLALHKKQIVYALHSLFVNSQFYTHKKPDSFPELLQSDSSEWMIENENLSPYLLNNTFKTKLNGKGSRRNFYTFCYNIIQLKNLINLIKISYLTHENEITENKEDSELHDFIKKIKNNLNDSNINSDTIITKLKLYEEREKLYLLDYEIRGEYETLNQDYRLYYFDNTLIFIPKSLKSINLHWLKKYADTQWNLNEELNKNIILIHNTETDDTAPKLPKLLTIKVRSDISSISNEIIFMHKLKYAYPISEKFKQIYSGIHEFSEENINNMNLDDLITSYKLFGSLLDSPRKKDLYAICNVPELLDRPFLNIETNFLNPPTYHELIFFLDKANWNNLKTLTPDKKENYVENFLHFRHLLTSTRIAKRYKHLNPKPYIFLKNALIKFLENPLQRIPHNEFQSFMEFFFNPFNFFTDKVKNFWKYKYEISAYLLDYYNINRRGSCIYSHYNSKTLNPVPNTKVKPLMLLTFRNFQTVNFMLYITLNHELGHHLQQSEGFIHSFITDSIKVNNMGSELETDMYAGFYAHHFLGLDLNSNQIIEMSKLIEKHYGDRNPDFRSLADPHGEGYQRKRAYLLGANLAKLPQWKNVTANTKLELHKTFKKIYLNTDYLRRLDMYPETIQLFSEESLK